jgi:hypothetical protein
MRVACEQGLNRDFGVQLRGSVRDVRYSVPLMRTSDDDL